ncbi:MAG: hypothetical protein ABWX94_02730 [Candidatus Saccharimonadales bacterium]
MHHMNSAPEMNLPPQTEVPQLAELAPPPPQAPEQQATIPEQSVAPPAGYQEQIPQESMPVFEEVPAAPQSFGERLKNGAQEAYAVAKRLGSAVLESVVSIDREDLAGNSHDAGKHQAERVINRIEDTSAMTSVPEAGQERAADRAAKAAKAAKFAVKAYGVYKTVKPLVKPLVAAAKRSR